jgi:hypothetical protein
LRMGCPGLRSVQNQCGIACPETNHDGLSACPGVDEAVTGRVVSGRYHPVLTNHGQGTGADPSRDRFGRFPANYPLDELWSQLTCVHYLVVPASRNSPAPSTVSRTWLPAEGPPSRVPLFTRASPGEFAYPALRRVATTLARTCFGVPVLCAQRTSDWARRSRRPERARTAAACRGTGQ